VGGRSGVLNLGHRGTTRTHVAQTTPQEGLQIVPPSPPGCKPIVLVLIVSYLLAGALASQSLFYPAFLTGFQVEGVSLDLFDDVFLLDLALETS